jgi:rubrerythrin
MNKTVRFHNFRRIALNDTVENLLLEDGVNLLVGPPNTGKTKWLQMIDFLLGDTDVPEKEFGPELAAKYKEIAVELAIGGQTHELKRNWFRPGQRGKLTIDGNLVDAEEFSAFTFEELGWPLLRYPQGNPYNQRQWKTLGWRSLFRHMYRQQEYWGDLVDKQFPAEQHACILFFLGLAERLFSPQSSVMISKDKERALLEEQKTRFLQVLTDISAELLDEELVEITWDSLKKAIAEQNTFMHRVGQERESLLARLKARVADGAAMEELEREWAFKNEEMEQLFQEQAKIQSKLEETIRFHEILRAELGRLKRAIAAGDVLGTFHVSRCPSCNQSVENRPVPAHFCPVCTQPLPEDQTKALELLEAESYHSEGNLEETTALIERLSNSLQILKRRHTTAREASNNIDQKLKLYREQINAFASPELSAIDMELGRIQERIRQLERIGNTLQRRDEISKQIDNLDKEITVLEAAVKLARAGLDFEQAADDLSSGMNTYLNELTKRQPGIWQQEEVKVRLSENFFDVFVGSVSAKQKLGGSNKLRLWMAYHYALLGLTLSSRRRYPGLVIIDFPARLEDGSTVADKEDFIIEPFVELIKSSNVPMQVIAAGSAFDHEGTNRIKLSHVWGRHSV